MLEKVRRFIEENRLFYPGERVGVAVSGGVDSIVLLHVLRSLDEYGLSLTICHLDHGLRRESAFEAEFVEQISEEYGCPFIMERLNVRARARERRISLEMAAREMRYESLLRMAEERRLDCVALGHHRDDQTETILLRILRGTGLDGLGGMRASRDGRLVRPFLEVGRGEILAYAGAKGLSWRDDISNEDTSIPRNRVRHRLLPDLRREYNPGIERALLDLASVARETLEHLENELAAAWPGLNVLRHRNGLSFDGGTFAGLPPALAGLAVRRLFAQAGGDPGRLSYAATGRMRRFVLGAGGARLSVPGDFSLVRHRGTFFLERAAPSPPMERMELAVPGRVQLPDGRFVSSEWWPGNHPEWSGVGRNDAFIDGDVAQLPLAVRSRRPGDRFQPLGLSADKKVKEILVNTKIPREDRNAVPLIVDRSDRIVWIGGIRPDHRYRVTAQTTRLIHLRLYSKSGSLS